MQFQIYVYLSTSYSTLMYIFKCNSIYLHRILPECNSKYMSIYLHHILPRCIQMYFVMSWEWCHVIPNICLFIIYIIFYLDVYIKMYVYLQIHLHPILPKCNILMFVYLSSSYSTSIYIFKCILWCAVAPH